jgi:hypothetical protein
MADLFDLLDKNLDDIADLPSFKVPDTGIYKLTLGMEVKEINDKPSVIAKLTVRELVELADSSVPENERAKAGDKFDIPHILKYKDGNDSEIGWGRLKELVTPFEELAGTKNLKAIVKYLSENPVDITAKIKKVERKNDKGVFDGRIDNITID